MRDAPGSSSAFGQTGVAAAWARGGLWLRLIRRRGAAQPSEQSGLLRRLRIIIASARLLGALALLAAHHVHRHLLLVKVRHGHHSCCGAGFPASHRSATIC
jgi:hypothetical protein